jgi:hypothetical protein
MEKFLYLKLGDSNCLADYWLSKDNVYKRSVVAIYFGPIKANEYRKIIRISDKETRRKKEEYVKLYKNHNTGDSDKARRRALFQLNQIEEFFEAGENAQEKRVQKATFVTIAYGKVYIYEPESRVLDMRKEKYEEYDASLREWSREHPELRARINGMKIKLEKSKGEIRHIPKIMHVRVLESLRVARVPHVLATLPCNQYFTRGTCREIHDWGVIQAIKHCLGRKIDTLKLSESPYKLMELLSPYELETLVFLILRSEGLFVPAWRGGTQKDIDIIGINREYREIKIGTDHQVTFPPKGKRNWLTFQVKRGNVGQPSEADYTIATDFDGNNDKILTAKWLLQQIKTPTQRETREWLLNSLDWVPNVGSLISKEL